MSARPAAPRPRHSGVHIVATSIRCAVGFTAASAGAAIRAGVSRVAEHPFLIDAVGDKILCARDPSIDAGISGAARMLHLVERCLGDVATQLAAAAAWTGRVSVMLALPEPRPGFTEADAVNLQQSLARRPILAAPSIGVACVGEGHAGALWALSAAADRIVAGEELVIAGGVDSYLHQDTIGWLDAQRRLSRPEIRSGLPPGEGCAFVALAGADTCHRLGLRSLGRLRGVGCAAEARDPLSDLGLLGEGLTQAILEATKDLSLPEEVVTDTYGDINGERHRNEDWGFALMRTAPWFRDGTAYVSAAGQCGDVGAATGALGCVLATEAWRFGCAHGARALVWAGSWSGLRGAAVVEHATG